MSASMTAKTECWIAADFTDGHLVIWAMTGETVSERAETSCPADGIMTALDDLRAQLGAAHATAPVMLSGAETTAAIAVPAKPAELPVVAMGETDVHLIAGLSQNSPVARMGGAATRIAGFLSLNPNWDGVVCLPGETTHWALISANEVVSFQSFLTAGLWRALAPQLGLDPLESAATAATSALTGAMESVQSRPEAMAARVAELQADQSGSPQDRAARLWGLLLGAELSAARPYWLGQNIALVSPAEIEPAYAAALGHQGIPLTRTDGERMALAGLVSAWRTLSA